MRKNRSIDSDIFIHAPFGILHATTAGKLQRANPAIAEMLGYDSPEELIETVNRAGMAETLLEGPAARTALIEETPRTARGVASRSGTGERTGRRSMRFSW